MSMPPSYPQPPADQPPTPPAYPSAAPPAYPQAPGGYPPPPVGYGAPVGSQRNMIIFVVSIILLVGAFLDLISAFGYFAASVSSTIAETLTISHGMLAVLGVLSLVGVVVMAVVGIIGIRNAANPAKAPLLVVLGIVLIAFGLVNIIVTIAATRLGAGSVLGLLLPVLFLIGALQMKKAAAAQR